MHLIAGYLYLFVIHVIKFYRKFNLKLDCGITRKREKNPQAPVSMLNVKVNEITIRKTLNKCVLFGKVAR